jgi:acetolactate synthase-1/2/3 large subunit
MSKSEKSSVDRRSFLKGAAVGAAALVPKPPIAAQQVAQTRVAGAALAAETSEPSAKVDVMTLERPGSDFMLDVIKSLGIEYCCANPGSSFRALHESIINYGGNKNPEMITCCHEESSVAMAHGYAKIEGKPIMALAHGTVGVQHAAMAIYNAYVDRVPVYIVLGNILDATFRRDQVEWNHAVQDAASMVRDYVKWDDTPVSLAHFAESAVRAYKIAMTPPLEPVVIVADATLQEEPIKETNLRIPKLSLASPPQGDSGAVADAAKLLVAAENPLIVAGRAARTPNGVKLLVELAETLQAPIQDQRLRMNFPTRHPLFGAGNVRNSDVILGLEAMDFWGLVHQQSSFNRTGIQETSLIKPGTKLISITALDLNHKANYQDFGRFEDVDLAIAADAEATLPSLIEACKRLITPDRKRALQERGAKLAQASQRVRDRDRELAAVGWD